ncbi:phosphoribosyl-ATP diphosphatase [Roseomonas sp. WA12]
MAKDVKPKRAAGGAVGKAPGKVKTAGPEGARAKAKAKPSAKGKAPAAEAEQARRAVKAKPAKARGKVKMPKLKPAKWKEDSRVPPLPVPEDLADAPIEAGARAPKRVRRAEARHLAPLDPGRGEPVAAVLDRLWSTVDQRRIHGDAETSHSARLLARGTAKVAQKLGEEAVEAVIEAMAGNRRGLIGESADLLYHLIVVWVDAGIRPEDVWAELVRREGLSGIAEKAARQNLSLAGILKAGETTKLP